MSTFQAGHSELRWGRQRLRDIFCIWETSSLLKPRPHYWNLDIHWLKRGFLGPHLPCSLYLRSLPFRLHLAYFPGCFPVQALRPTASDLGTSKTPSLTGSLLVWGVSSLVAWGWGCGGRSTAVTNSGHQSLSGAGLGGAGVGGQKRGRRLVYSDGDPPPHEIGVGPPLLFSSPTEAREENDVSALALTLWTVSKSLHQGRDSQEELRQQLA